MKGWLVVERYISAGKPSLEKRLEAMENPTELFWHKPLTGWSNLLFPSPEEAFRHARDLWWRLSTREIIWVREHPAPSRVLFAEGTTLYTLGNEALGEFRGVEVELRKPLGQLVITGPTWEEYMLVEVYEAEAQGALDAYFRWARGRVLPHEAPGR
uniref:Uncharacterized protein n=1 Tax=Thermus caliditerrae TaxID=1330700 RepID=A0A7C5VK52_9DEIN